MITLIMNIVMALIILAIALAVSIRVIRKGKEGDLLSRKADDSLQ